VSRRLVEALRRPAGTVSDLSTVAPDTAEDLQITLYICYELHYRGFDEVDERWEWDPGLLRLRAAAEERFERQVRVLVGSVAQVEASGVGRALVDLVEADDGPPLARFLERGATLPQFREFAVHRSIYQLKEADPYTWAIPRLAGRAKAALVEIQVDEYGGGQVSRMHAELFRTALAGLGLSNGYGDHVDAVPAVTLAIGNLISMFGLHRRLRGALLGHLAAYEMTSSVPNRRYGNALRRFGFDERVTRFYDEHVEADAVHEQIAAHDMCGGFCADEPDLVDDVLFGAAAALALDRRFAGYVLGCWQNGRSSLHPEKELAAA
jgi:hypothetical protein